MTDEPQEGCGCDVDYHESESTGAGWCVLKNSACDYPRVVRELEEAVSLLRAFSIVFKSPYCADKPIFQATLKNVLANTEAFLERKARA